MKKILTVVVAAFALNALAAAPAADPKPEDKSAKKVHVKKGDKKEEAAKADAGTAM